MTAEEIVRALAAHEPLVEYYEEMSGSRWICGLCDADSAGHESHWINRPQLPAVFEPTDDPTPHAPRCLWMQAKAWVAEADATSETKGNP